MADFRERGNDPRGLGATVDTGALAWLRDRELGWRALFFGRVRFIDDEPVLIEHVACCADPGLGHQTCGEGCVGPLNQFPHEAMALAVEALCGYPLEVGPWHYVADGVEARCARKRS